MSLPEPNFVDRDPAALTAEMVADYQAYTGRKLQPAQVERLIIDLIAYRESLIRVAIQEAAKQNLLAFAAFPMLDYLGELLGVERLAEAPAIVTLSFTLAEPRVSVTVIPAGTRVRTGDGRVVFVTDAAAEIPAGALSIEIGAKAETAGPAGNGYIPGQVSSLLDPLPGVTATNVSVTYGGRAGETDDRLRARIQQAPESFSVAGPVGAYRWHAVSAHQSIIDAAVLSPRPGLVRIHILTDTGLPGSEMLDLVAEVVSDDKVRPLTDKVEVAAPVRVGYQIAAQVTLYRNADPTSTMAAVQKAAETYAAERRAGLGRDLVPSQFISALSVAGVYRVELTTPAWRELGAEEWADCEGIAITLAGSADG